MKTNWIICGLAGLMAAGVSGCMTTDADRGTAIGAGTGAALGAIMAHNFGDSGPREKAFAALAGAAVGGLVGNQYGRGNDQEREIAQLRVQQSMQTVWIANRNGSRVPVTLRMTDGGQFIGPRGEYYGCMPSEQQLAQLYGM